MHRVLVHFKMVASKMRINSVIASSQLWYSKRFWCIETAITNSYVPAVGQQFNRIASI